MKEPEMFDHFFLLYLHTLLSTSYHFHLQDIYYSTGNLKINGKEGILAQDTSVKVNTRLVKT